MVDETNEQEHKQAEEAIFDLRPTINLEMPKFNLNIFGEDEE